MTGGMPPGGSGTDPGFPSGHEEWPDATLAAALRRQVELVRALQAAAKEVEAALVSRDLGRLAAAAQEQLRLSQELQEAAGPGTAGREGRSPASGTGDLPPGWRAEVEPLARELAEAVAELQARQELNRRLLEDALAHTAFVLQVLTGSGPDPGLYGLKGGRPGRAGTTVPERRAVDWRA